MHTREPQVDFLKEKIEQSNEENDIPSVITEEDKPPPSYYIVNETKISNKAVDELERMASVHRHIVTDRLRIKSYGLLCWCIGILIVLYIGDVFLINFGLKNSNMITSLIELFKYLVSAVVGYTLSKRE